MPEPNPKPSSLRPILPAPQTSLRSAFQIDVGTAAKRRAPVTAACGECRRRKSKCNGGRPKCTSCIRRRVECIYDRDPDETQAAVVKRKYEELRDHNTPFERVFDAIRCRSEADAGAIVRKIRRGENVDDIARQVEHGDLLLQSCLMPETKYRYEFPFSWKMPSYLLLKSNVYLDSPIYKWSPHQHLPSEAVAVEVAGGSSSSRQQPSSPSAEFDAPYLKPYHAAEMVDTQLSSAVPSKWTSVCSDDVLMRRLLGAFFLQEHDWWTVLQKDYFLQDMSSMHHDFCSSLLVNAVLAQSCSHYRGLSDRVEFWNPQTLGYRFLAEAKRLWEYEKDNDALTTLQAALVLHIIYSGSGADKIGFAYTVQACAIAHRLDLYNPNCIVKSTRLRDARNYTAWALYSWQSLMCFHYFKPPLVEKPPAILPHPKDVPAWYGETWLKYPLSSTLFPSNSGDVFKARAEFAMIQNDVARRLFASPASASQLSAVEVAGFYYRFKSWYDSLPEALSPQRAVLPSHLKVHMHYFQVLLRLLQSPSLVNKQGSEAAAAVTDLLGHPPQQLLLHAKVSLETLLRAYYLRHGFEWLDTYLVSLMIETSFIAIEGMKVSGSEEELSALRSTIILLAKGIYEQGQNFFLGKLVFQLVSSKMRPEDLDLLGQIARIESIGEKQAVGLRQAQMEWPVEVTSMADDPESKRLGGLIKKLRESSLEAPSKQDTL
ncbi:Zn(2)-C6 fungal-type DNA-binding domain protein [Metarhizium rileyi]|uniref:Zn(2)-C6 fungal-type DNA-binding domain protein n=1 Tax=Metarhizium rileyi (strain RCEF 4871) TaxID=1649241 RepID=A0A166XDP0_METRR|nr:Zn(2)-C6 fungal-type DNA-binding domain protein [Metarhizium rileyi RCEF 4871]